MNDNDDNGDDNHNKNKNKNNNNNNDDDDDDNNNEDDNDNINQDDGTTTITVNHGKGKKKRCCNRKRRHKQSVNHRFQGRKERKGNQREQQQQKPTLEKWNNWIPRLRERKGDPDAGRRGASSFFLAFADVKREIWKSTIFLFLKNKYRGDTSDAATPLSLILSLIMMSYEDFLPSKTAVFVV